MFVGLCFFFPAEDGIRGFRLSRGLGDVCKRQGREFCAFRPPIGVDETPPILYVEGGGVPIARFVTNRISFYVTNREKWNKNMRIVIQQNYMLS